MKRTDTLAAIIASVYTAKANCENSGNSLWLQKWSSILDVCADELPSGSGFDSGTQIEDATASVIKLKTAFHHMNDGGYYDGWTEHVVTVRAEFNSLDIKVSGRNRNDIKDYIGEVFYSLLNNPLSDAAWNRVQAILQG